MVRMWVQQVESGWKLWWERTRFSQWPVIARGFLLWYTPDPEVFLSDGNWDGDSILFSNIYFKMLQASSSALCSGGNLFLAWAHSELYPHILILCKTNSEWCANLHSLNVRAFTSCHALQCIGTLPFFVPNCKCYSLLVLTWSTML